MVAVYLMTLDSKLYLHVSDLQTDFSVAAFLKRESLGYVWLAFLKCLSTLYSGQPDEHRTDQGSVIADPKLKMLASVLRLEVKNLGI